jgi:hypothetical protein
MSDVKVTMQGAGLEWHSTEETPPLHSVEYAGEVWLQSSPLLLVNTAGKMAVGYCHQEVGGRPEFEVGAGNERLSNISFWALVEPPNQKLRPTEQEFIQKTIFSGQGSPS